MGVDQIRQDLMVLAGRLLHRGAQTDEERHAAEFIRERLREYTADVELQDFHAIDNYTYLFASYYTEFLVVAILAAFGWPLFAACYGVGVFLAYLAEFMGYRIFARFMPQFESQNVVARFFAPYPERLFIVTAHYDSGCANPLSNPRVLPWLRPIHRLLVLCMVTVIATCAAEAVGSFIEVEYSLTAYLRWAAVGMLLCAAIAMFYAATQGEDIRGANTNASGVAALLRVAERVAAHPLERADVWVVAAGSHESWMSGMRHFLTSHDFDKARTYILNLEGVGAGDLHYLTGEGMLQLVRSDKGMVAAAQRIAPQFGATAAKLRAIPSAAHVPLARGYSTLSVMGLDKRGLPPHWNWFTDRVTEVDETAIANAADFAEAIARNLEDELQTDKSL